MKQGQSNTKVAGVDVGKGKLDVAVHGEDELLQTDNAPSDFDKLERWLKGHGVSRVGLEATGGYEKKVAAFLVAQGFEVIVHQPMEVRLYGRLTRQRAKNDKADAILIAAFTASLGKIKAPADPKLAPLAERFCVYEQVTDQIAKLKTFLEHVTLKDILRRLKAQIRSLETLKTALAREIDQAIKADPAMLERYRLLLSIPGIGPITAASLIVRMPELGQMEKGQAASLLGVAPFDRDSGQYKGLRFISGGRARPRRLVYLAAVAAKRFDKAFKAFAERLSAAGKPPKVITVAVMRKLIEAANLVLKRGQPWLNTAAA